MLSAALRRHAGDRAFDDLQKSLLHAFTGNVARDGHVLALSGDLVDLVDVNDAALRLFDVVIGVLNEFEENVLHVLSDVARLGQRGRIGRRERHVQDAREGAREQGLAAARRPEKQDIALFDLDVVVRLGDLAVDALVMIVYGDGQHFFGFVLPDDIFVEFRLDLGGLFQLHLIGRRTRYGLDLFVADLDALVADIQSVRSRDQPLDLVFALSAKRTELFFVSHGSNLPRAGRRGSKNNTKESIRGTNDSVPRIFPDFTGFPRRVYLVWNTLSMSP